MKVRSSSIQRSAEQSSERTAAAGAEEATQADERPSDRASPPTIAPIAAVLMPPCRTADSTRLPSHHHRPIRCQFKMTHSLLLLAWRRSQPSNSLVAIQILPSFQTASIAVQFGHPSSSVQSAGSHGGERQTHEASHAWSGDSILLLHSSVSRRLPLPRSASASARPPLAADVDRQLRLLSDHALLPSKQPLHSGSSKASRRQEERAPASCFCRLTSPRLSACLFFLSVS